MTGQDLLNSVGIEQAQEIITMLYTSAFLDGRLPPRIAQHGTMGVGKSAIGKVVCENLQENLRKGFNNPEIKVIMFDVRLGAVDPSAVQGIPFNVPGTHDLVFSTPEWFPHDGRIDENTYVILHFDELMNCDTSTQHAAYRIILDRSINNGKTLSERVAILATGNQKEDSTGARALLPAMANRFDLHLVIDKDKTVEGSLNHMFRSGWDSRIFGFLSWKSEYVIAPYNNNPAFARPRTWESVNEHLKCKELNRPENESLLNIVVAGAVGTDVAIEFRAFLETHEKLPDWKRIRSGDKNYKYEMPENDEALKFALGTALSFQLLDALRNDLKTDVENLSKYVAKLSSEFKIVMFKTMARDFSVMTRLLHHQSLKSEWETVKKYVSTK